MVGRTRALLLTLFSQAAQATLALKKHVEEVEKLLDSLEKEKDNGTCAGRLVGAPKG